jgi:hypothetical protein
MKNRSLISETIDLWQKDRKAGWDNPSWWNLLVLWPVPFVLLFCIRASVTDSKVAQRQLSAVATINAHDPPNHDRYGYVFKVGGEQFTGWAYPSDGHAYSIGEHVDIYFDPLNPAKNSTVGFRSVAIDDLFFVPFCVVVLAGLPVFIYLRRSSWKRKCQNRSFDSASLGSR